MMTAKVTIVIARSPEGDAAISAARSYTVHEIASLRSQGQLF
jgi:hypothetical protein